MFYIFYYSFYLLLIIRVGTLWQLENTHFQEQIFIQFAKMYHSDK